MCIQVQLWTLFDHLDFEIEVWQWIFPAMQKDICTNADEIQDDAYDMSIIALESAILYGPERIKTNVFGLFPK